MVHNLSPKEVVDNWKTINTTLRKAFEIPDEEEKTIFNRVLLGLSHVWMGYKTSVDEEPLYMIITSFQKRTGRDEKILMLTYLFSFTEDIIPEEVWKEDYKVLKKFAIELKCTAIGAYTENLHVYKLFKTVDNIKEYLYMEANIL